MRFSILLKVISRLCPGHGRAIISLWQSTAGHRHLLVHVNQFGRAVVHFNVFRHVRVTKCVKEFTQNVHIDIFLILTDLDLSIFQAQP